MRMRTRGRVPAETRTAAIDQRGPHASLPALHTLGIELLAGLQASARGSPVPALVRAVAHADPPRR